MNPWLLRIVLPYTTLSIFYDNCKHTIQCYFLDSASSVHHVSMILEIPHTVWEENTDIHRFFFLRDCFFKIMQLSLYGFHLHLSAFLYILISWNFVCSNSGSSLSSSTYGLSNLDCKWNLIFSTYHSGSRSCFSISINHAAQIPLLKDVERGAGHGLCPCWSAPRTP